MLSKFGLTNTLLLLTIGIFLSIPILSFLSVRELYGQKKLKMKPKPIDNHYIIKKCLTDLKFISYVMVLISLCSVRAMLHSKGVAILQECSGLNTKTAAIISSWGSIIYAILRLLAFSAIVKDASPLKLTSFMLSLHIISFAGLLLNRKKIPFSFFMLMLQSAVGFVLPLRKVLVDSLNTEKEKRALNDMQIYITLISSK